MRVFVTGATGFVGSAVVQELLSAGHQVLGLARSDESARALAATGAEVHRGTLEDIGSLRSGAAATDGVIHTAFIHDFSKFAANCETDRQAIEAMGAELAGSGRPFIITSGTAFINTGRTATEEDTSDAGTTSIPRVATEIATASIAKDGVNTSLLRLPPSVHGKGDHGFVPMLIAVAREKGISAYIGEGLNQWPAVHRLDAARVYRLALEKGAAGARYHAVADTGVPFRQIAEAIGRGLNVPVVSISPEQAAGHFGWFAHFAAINSPASSILTQEQLGWEYTHQGLIADLDEGHYFES